MMENGKLLKKCEKLEATVLHLKNNSGPPDSSKP
jgi:hypothetical protein